MTHKYVDIDEDAHFLHGYDTIMEICFVYIYSKDGKTHMRSYVVGSF